MSNVHGSEPRQTATPVANGLMVLPPQTDTPLAVTHFIFEAKVFQVEEAVFSLAEDRRTALFSVPLGEMVGRLTIPTVRRAFEIAPDSHDDQLLGLVEESLRFVKSIRPGDAIPNELLDGTASWSVEPRHQERAALRVLRQLVNFAHPNAAGSAPETLPDAAILLMREAVADGIARYWRDGPAAHELIDQRIGQLMHEVAFIEALSDYFEGLLTVDRRLRQAVPLFTYGRATSNDYARVLPMMAKPKSWGRAMLAAVDHHVLDALVERQGFTTRIAAIQGVRNSLHFEMRDWNDLIVRWKAHTIDETPETEQLVRDTYRFLLQRYPLQRNWLGDDNDRTEVAYGA